MKRESRFKDGGSVIQLNYNHLNRPKFKDGYFFIIKVMIATTKVKSAITKIAKSIIS